MAEEKTTQPRTMRPMGWVRSLFFFGIPALLMFAFFRGLIPLLDFVGIHLFYVYLIGFGILPVVLLLASMGSYQKEGHALFGKGFSDRFRLHTPRGQDWLWTILLAIVLYGSREILVFTSAWFDSVAGSPPVFWFRMLDRDPNYFMELPFPGNWWILVGLVLLNFITAFCYELWFRGYILPRQELKFGEWAFLINGILWSLFHVYFVWDWLRILPGALLLPFAVQRLRNTWIGIIASFAICLPDLIYVVRGILGG